MRFSAVAIGVEGVEESKQDTLKEAKWTKFK